MTIRDLAHLLLTAPDLDRDVKISTEGYKSHITRVEFIENGEFLIGSNEIQRHGDYSMIRNLCREIIKEEIADRLSIDISLKKKEG